MFPLCRLYAEWKFCASTKIRRWLRGDQTVREPHATTHEPAEDHLRIPNHRNLRVGLLAAILDDVAAHLSTSREELIKRIFDEAETESASRSLPRQSFRS